MPPPPGGTGHLLTPAAGDAAMPQLSLQTVASADISRSEFTEFLKGASLGKGRWNVTAADMAAVTAEELRDVLAGFEADGNALHDMLAAFRDEPELLAAVVRTASEEQIGTVVSAMTPNLRAQGDLFWMMVDEVVEKVYPTQHRAEYTRRAVEARAVGDRRAELGIIRSRIVAGEAPVTPAPAATPDFTSRHT